MKKFNMYSIVIHFTSFLSVGIEGFYSPRMFWYLSIRNNELGVFTLIRLFWRDEISIYLRWIIKTGK